MPAAMILQMQSCSCVFRTQAPAGKISHQGLVAATSLCLAPSSEPWTASLVPDEDYAIRALKIIIGILQPTETFGVCRVLKLEFRGRRKTCFR